MPFFRHCTDHVKNFVLCRHRTDRFYIRPLNRRGVLHIAKQLFELIRNIFHVIAGLFQKQIQGILRDIFSFLFDHSKHPRRQRARILPPQLHDPPLRLDRLVELPALVDLLLDENHVCLLRHRRQIFRKLRASVLEKSAVLDLDQPALRKKGHCLRCLDHLTDIDSLSCISSKIHQVVLPDEGCTQTLFIAVFQIGLLSGEQINLQKGPVLQIGI